MLLECSACIDAHISKPPVNFDHATASWRRPASKHASFTILTSTAHSDIVYTDAIEYTDASNQLLLDFVTATASSSSQTFQLAWKKQTDYTRVLCRDRAPSYNTPRAPDREHSPHTMKAVRVRPEPTQPAPERDGEGASPRASASGFTSPGAPVGPEPPAPAAPPELSLSTEPPSRLGNGSASSKVDMVDTSPRKCSERAKSVWHTQVSTQRNTGGGGPA